MMRLSLPVVQVRVVAFTVIASLFSLSGVKACSIVYPAPPPRQTGETDAQFNIRYRAHIAQLEREEVASRPLRELRRQAELWRTADQILLVDDALVQAKPSRQVPKTALRVPKRSPQTKGKLLPAPIPPPPPRMPIVDPYKRSRVVEVSTWLKGKGRDRQLRFTSGMNNCGSFLGPAATLGPLLLFAPLGSIREHTLLDFIEADKIVDPDIAAALTRAQSKQQR